MATHQDAGLEPGSLLTATGRYRQHQWRRVGHGLYLHATVPESLTAICMAWLRVLPVAARFGHLTGATLRGWWLPPLPHDLPIFATVPADGSHPQRSGLVVRRQCDVRGWPVDQVTGLPLVPASRTAQDLASDLCVLDLVVMLDSAVRAGHCTLSQLEQASRESRRGAKTLRAALRVVDPRSESPWETVLRLLHVLCGFTAVASQAWIEDATGIRLARADLRLVGTNRLPEYDGEAHRGRRQHRSDLARDRRLARAGYERYGYTDVDLLRRPGQVIRDAEAALGLVHEPDRVAPWLEQLRLSLFTPSGQKRLRDRWKLGERKGT